MKTNKQIIQFLHDIIENVDSDIAYSIFTAPEDKREAKETIAELVNITKEFLES